MNLYGCGSSSKRTDGFPTSSQLSSGATDFLVCPVRPGLLVDEKPGLLLLPGDPERSLIAASSFVRL